MKTAGEAPAVRSQFELSLSGPGRRLEEGSRSSTLNSRGFFESDRSTSRSSATGASTAVSRAGRQGADPVQTRRRCEVASHPRPLASVDLASGRECATARGVRRLVVQWWHPITALSNWYVSRRARTSGAPRRLRLPQRPAARVLPVRESSRTVGVGRTASLIAL